METRFVAIVVLHKSRCLYFYCNLFDLKADTFRDMLRIRTSFQRVFYPDDWSRCLFFDKKCR